MGSIRDYIGIKQKTNEGETSLQSLSTLTNYIPLTTLSCSRNDLVISGNAITLTLGLARNDEERWYSAYEKPVLHLNIIGRDAQGKYRIVKIYHGTQNSSEISITWKKHYGIAKININLSDSRWKANITSISQIVGIGVALFEKENKGLSNIQYGVSNVFCFNNTDLTSEKTKIFNDLRTSSTGQVANYFSEAGLTAQNLDIVQISQLSNIDKFETNHVSSSTSIPEKIIFKPFLGSLYDYVTLLGIQNSDVTDNYTYSNTQFFEKRVEVSAGNIPSFISGLSFGASYLYTKMSNVNTPTFSTFSGNNKIVIDDYKTLYDDENSEIGISYGGYTYIFPNIETKLRYRDDARFVSNGSDLPPQFEFEKDNYRDRMKYLGEYELVYNSSTGRYDKEGSLNPAITSFVKYHLDCVIKLKEGEYENFPFVIPGYFDGNANKLSIKTYYSGYFYIENNTLKTKEYGSNSTAWFGGSNYGYLLGGKGAVINKFTNKPLEHPGYPSDTGLLSFTIGLKDGTKRYWKVCENLSIYNPNNKTTNTITQNTSEAVCYKHETFNKQAGYLVDVYQTQINGEKLDFKIIESTTPIENPKAPKENTILASKDCSYFEYIFPISKYTRDKVTIQADQKFYKLPYYVILHSRMKKWEGETEDIKLEVTNNGYFKDIIKIQENKLYFTFAEPIGDYNSDFSGDQFINYAILNNSSIGLSQIGRAEYLTLKITGIKQPLSITFRNGVLFSWKTWLELFYTNKQNVLDFSMAGIDLTKETQVFLTLTFYNKNKEPLFVIKNTKAIVPITGTRPLGFRQNGIIVNPVDPNEDLQQGTASTSAKVAERINARTYWHDDDTIRAILLEGRALNEHGSFFNEEKIATPLIVYEEHEHEIEEGKVGYDGTGGYLFDGVNLPGLQKKVEDDIKDMTYQKDPTKSDSFAGQINTNKNSISTLKNNIKNAQTKLISKLGSEHTTTITSGQEEVTGYSGTITVPSTDLANCILLSCQVSAQRTGGTGTFSNFTEDVGAPYVNAITYSNGAVIISYAGLMKLRKDGLTIKSGSKFQVRLSALALNLASL